MPTALRVARRAASRTADSSLAAWSIQTATNTIVASVGGSRPSATASSTPWPTPSWVAPKVILACRSPASVDLFIITVGGQTGS